MATAVQSSPTVKRSKKKSIQLSDPGKILDLVMSLRDNSCSQLQIRINNYLMEECDAELAFQVVVNGDRKEAYIETVASTALSRKMKIYLCHKLSDTLKTSHEQSDLVSNLGTDVQQIILPFLKPTKDLPVTKKRVIMLSVADKPFSIIVCVVSPKEIDENVATFIYELFLFVWPTLKNAINLEYECSLKQKCQQLLRVARRLFTQVASLETLLRIAMDQAKQLAKAEYCSVKLIDVERMELFETIVKKGHYKHTLYRKHATTEDGLMEDETMPLEKQKSLINQLAGEKSTIFGVTSIKVFRADEKKRRSSQLSLKMSQVFTTEETRNDKKIKAKNRTLKPTISHIYRLMSKKNLMDNKVPIIKHIKPHQFSRGIHSTSSGHSLSKRKKSILKTAHYSVDVKSSQQDMISIEMLKNIRTASLLLQEEKDEKIERRFPMNIGITGRVIHTGHLINTKNAKDHPHFNASIDTLPGVNCRTLLCFPIREQTGIIGVGQLINKVGDPYFDGMDEEMALAFSIYCGVCIVHSVVYEKIQEAHIRNALANELVMYHMKVGDAEVSRMLECTGFHNHPQLTGLHFNPRALPMRELPCYVLRMFSDLGLDKKFQIKSQKLARFILHVKKGYRDVPYHNWTHAFNVAQWAFAALVNFKLVTNGYFNELQQLMFIVSSLVHDLDHRGTTNSFHLQGQTTLAALYSSEGSVMERHHIAQAMCILNTEGCDILESLPRRDYDRAILMLRDFVMASDLANYFRNLPDYKLYAQDYQKTNRTHAAALQALLMNAADLSDVLKDWGSVKKTAAAVLTEFFHQGDVEKSRGDLPDMMMDRDKCFIPELEIQFLTMTCIPLYKTLGKIIPKASSMVKIIENHIERWDAAKSVFAEVPISGGLAVLLSPELDNLIEMNLMEKERLAAEAQQADDEAN